MSEKITLRQGELNEWPNGRLAIDWLLTKKCNYRCTYCTVYKENPEVLSSLDQLQHAVDIIAQQNRQSIDFFLTGGEPTIHPELPTLYSYISKMLSGRLNSILLVTNGSRSPEYYLDLVKKSPNTPLFFKISLHSEFFDLANLESVIRSLSSKATVSCSLMFNPTQRDTIFEAYAALCHLRKTHFFNASMTLLRGAPTFITLDERYTEADFIARNEADARFQAVVTEAGVAPPSFPRPHYGRSTRDFIVNGQKHTEYLSANHNDNVLQGNLNFQGMWCTMGTRVLAIDPDGTCCGARCGIAAQKRMNIYAENPYQKAFFPDVVQCTKSACTCGTNTPIPKFKELAEAQAFLQLFPSGGVGQ